MPKAKTTKSGNIIMLPVTKLHPHPDNPRDDLGDLTELSASIARNGVMQNLTVVESSDGYTVVIGHRRLAAAKKAGLAELPCAVVEMTPRQQHETMLAENMLREELTLAKQVQAFEQLSLDGATADEIAETTGFAVRTVAKRLRYAEKIGVEDIRNAEKKALEAGRQLTVDELDKLCSVESSEKRTELAKDLGTNNFGYRYQSVKQSEENDKNHRRFTEIAEAAGLPLKKESNSSDWDYMVVMYSAIAANDCKTLEDIFAAVGRRPPDGAELFRTETPGSWGTITWKRAEKPEAVSSKPDAGSAKKEEAARAERMRKLSDAFETAYKSRREFITKDDLIMANVPDVMQFLYDAASKNNGEPEEFAEIVGLDPAEYTDDDDYDHMAEDIRGLIAAEYALEKCRSALKTMKRHCVLFAYVMWGDSGSRCGVDSVGRFHDDWGGIAEFRKLYDYLDRFGYDISDDEAELLDGTSELYLHEEEET